MSFKKKNLFVTLKKNKFCGRSFWSQFFLNSRLLLLFSPHIYVNNSPRLSHANLNTYNPTSLCTLDSCVIKAGDVYKLEVNGLVDSEAYVRVCVSKRYSEYINGPETLEGAKNLPEFRGKRFMIKPSAQEVFILRVEEDNIAIQR